MKKNNLRNLLCLALVMLGIASTAQEVRTFQFDHNGKNGIRLVQQTRGNVALEYNIDAMSLTSFTYDGEEMQTIGINDISLPNAKGLPNVPSYSRTIAIPQGAKAVMHVVSYEQQVIKNVNVEPSLGIQDENSEPDMNYTKDMKVYSENTFYPAEFATISQPTSIRGVDVVNINVNPVRFNPVTKEAVVYHNIELEVEFVGGNGQFGDNRLRSQYFDPILAQNILNYNSLPVIDYEARMQQWMRDGADGAEYLIIIPNNDGFVEPAQRLKEYRMQQGIITEIYRLEDMPATTTQMMKTWFHDAYNTWDIAPVAVLLFADHNTNMSQGIPAESIYHSSSYGNCITDNQYADVTGDFLPEMIFSRLVAANPTEAAMMADKQIAYEYTSPNMDPAAYNAPITALGWQTERWFQLCSEVVGGYFRAHGKTPLRVNCIYDGTPGSSWSSAQNTSQVVSYFGPSGTNYIPQTPDQLGGFNGGTPEQIVQAINQGTMLVQHRDHGLETGWGEPAFRNSHVAQLTNVGKLPFVFSINCETGMFDYSSDCFAEAFMRRTYNGENAGAVGLICPTDVSYSFVNDALVWGIYDQFQPDFMPTYGPYAPNEGNWFPAFGLVGGKYFLSVTSWPYNSDSKYITYQMFTAHCDAFLRLYSELPETMSVNHQNVQVAGLDQFQITAPEGTTIALTKGEGESLEIVAVATATGGQQEIAIPAQVPPTILHLTVTGQNYLRYQANIEVIPATGPYLVVNEYELINSATQLNFGDETGFDIQLKNVGSSQAQNGTATLTTDSEYITITNGTCNFAAIASNATTDIDNAFSFTVSDEVPDRTRVEFLVTINSGNDTYENHITMRICAPVFEIGNVTITEIDGNGNGRLDPGETVKLTFPVKNKGNADSWATDATIVINNPFMQLTSEPTVNVSSIAADATANVEYTIYVGAAPSGFAADYTLNVASGAYTDTRDFMSKVGLNVEDFETAQLDPSMWSNDASHAWTFDTNDPYEGQYCLKSGSIGNNGETSVVLTYEVAENDSIAFYYKVSSEFSWDKLYFYIDNQAKDEWSGSISWTRAQYAVTAGTHTFKWKYAKDSSQTGGSDCCWIDFVILPADRSLAVSAGTDMEICEGESAQLAGFVNNQTSMEWSTAGDGTFNDVTIPDAIYTPGTQDIANGSVTLTITASQGTQTMSDEMTVSFRSAVSIEMPQGNNAIACMGIIDVTEYYVANNAESVMITSNGDGQLNNGIYTFGEQDIANGSVTLTITAYGCGEVSAEILVGYQGVPTISGIEEINTCSIAPIEIVLDNESSWCSMAGWTTAGTGTFSDPSSESTIYTPSEEDFNNGSVVLTAEYKDCQETSYYHNVTILFTEIATPSTPVGPTEVYNLAAVTEYSVEASLMFDSYEWVLEPATAGTMTPNGNTVSIAWNMDQTDTEVQLYVIGHNEMCGDSAPSQSLVISLTGHGVDEISATEINIHPNPTNDIVNVSIENLNANVQITIYNSVGQAVYTQNESVDNGFSTVINLGDLSNGTYILQVRSEEGIWMKRIIKR